MDLPLHSSPKCETALYMPEAQRTTRESLDSPKLAAVDAVRAANDGELPCGVTFVIEGEEEISSPHIAQFVQEHLELLNGNGSIWEEGGINESGRPVNTLGRRGILAEELQAFRLCGEMPIPGRTTCCPMRPGG